VDARLLKWRAARRSASSTPIALALLFVLALLCGAGCGKQQFEFIVNDEAGAPIAGGTIFYYPGGNAEKERVIVGQTDAAGSLIITGNHLSEGTWYLFEKECAVDVAGERFDPATCAIISGGAQGRYRFSRKDGLLRKNDLRETLRGKSWPGRRVQLTCEPVTDTDAEGSGRRRSLTRILDITSTPGAEVRVNGRTVAWIPESGWLNDSFCPGDSLACLAATCELELRLESYETVRQQVPLPEPAGRIHLEAPLARMAGASVGSGPAGAPSPTAASPTAPPPSGEATPPGYARIRIANQGFPQTCGDKGDSWPTLHVDRLSVSVASSSDNTAWKAYYDLLLRTGRSYKLAMECPEEGQTARSWNPWDDAAGQPKWYRIDIPADATELYFALPAFSPGGDLQIQPSRGNWQGFRGARATRID
jgi:hypothetical protein